MFCNPRGYPNESETGFDSGLVVEVQRPIGYEMNRLRIIYELVAGESAKVPMFL